MRGKGLLSVLLAISLVLWAGAVSAGRVIVLGSKSFTEQNLLSAITTLYLRQQGFKVQPRTHLASMILREAMLNGQVDLAFEYTGTSLIIYHQVTQPMSPRQAYATVKRLDAPLGLVWLNPSGINNTYAFAMRRARAAREKVWTLSQLAAKLNASAVAGEKRYSLALDMEFARRSDGLAPFARAYHLDLARSQIRQMEPGLVYNAIRDGFVDAGLVYATDGRINGFDLVVLRDDKQFFPGYAATPVVSAKTLAENPGLKQALNTLSSRLSQRVISQLNAKVDVQHQDIQQVARQFLQGQGLLSQPKDEQRNE